MTHQDLALVLDSGSDLNRFFFFYRTVESQIQISKILRELLEWLWCKKTKDKKQEGVCGGVCVGVCVCIGSGNAPFIPFCEANSKRKATEGHRYPCEPLDSAGYSANI